jgi:hypothetical protein
VRTLLLCAALLATGCTSLPPPAASSYLDENTGITLTVVDAPLVLARERREVAANVRDYLTIVGAARNQSGKVSTVLLVHRWTTIDDDARAVAVAPDAQLVIVADGRDLHLRPLPQLPREFSADNPRVLRPKVDRVQTTAYAVDAATLDFIGNSRQVIAWYEPAADPRSYSLWQDGRNALRRLAEELRP